jgi:hypothetical protein
VQTPAWQVLMSHWLPSKQKVPSATGGYEQVPVAGLHDPALWHWSGGAHVTAPVAVHVELTHVYVSHAFGPLHEAPFGSDVRKQKWVLPSAMQVPVRQPPSDGQTTGVTPVHTPDLHSAVSKQPVAGQEVPSGNSALVHAPVVGSQVPAAWHESVGAQETGVPVQVPAWHVSPTMQRLPSLHASPFATGTEAHVPVLGLHSLAWHVVEPAAQVTGFDATQYPDWQDCVWRQASPSLQGVPLGLGPSHVPVCGLHAPGMHWASNEVKSSVLDRVLKPASRPPVMRMAPEPVSVAVGWVRTVVSVEEDHEPVNGL